MLCQLSHGMGGDQFVKRRQRACRIICDTGICDTGPGRSARSVHSLPYCQLVWVTPVAGAVYALRNLCPGLVPASCWALLSRQLPRWPSWLLSVSPGPPWRTLHAAPRPMAVSTHNHLHLAAARAQSIGDRSCGESHNSRSIPPQGTRP